MPAVEEMPAEGPAADAGDRRIAEPEGRLGPRRTLSTSSLNQVAPLAGRRCTDRWRAIVSAFCMLLPLGCRGAGGVPKRALPGVAAVCSVDATGARCAFVARRTREDLCVRVEYRKADALVRSGAMCSGPVGRGDESLQYARFTRPPTEVCGPDFSACTIIVNTTPCRCARGVEVVWDELPVSIARRNVVTYAECKELINHYFKSVLRERLETAASAEERAALERAWEESLARGVARAVLECSKEMPRAVFACVMRARSSEEMSACYDARP